MPSHADVRTTQEVALLRTPVGTPGSGAVRYAAAMYLFTRDLMPLEMLEIYRVCSKFDHEDPVAVAAFEGVQIPALARPQSVADLP